MTATSGPGFSLMQEHIGYAAMTETPLVIVTCKEAHHQQDNQLWHLRVI